MTTTTWTQLINSGQYSQANAGTAYASSTSLTDISPGGSSAGQALLLPSSLLQSEVQLRVTGRGICSTTGSPNLTLGVYLGGVAGTALATSTFATSAAMSNATWKLTADIRCDGTGGSGTLRTLGEIIGLNPQPVMLPLTSSGGGAVTVNTGINNILTLGAQWGTNSASNTITCEEWLVEQLN